MNPKLLLVAILLSSEIRLLKCLNGAWYCVTGSKGGNTLAQYSRTAPFWKNIGSVCPAPKKTYSDPSSLEV